MAEIKRLGGTPEEVLNNRELMLMLLPTLRADFSLWEMYLCMRSVPLECPIVAFGGHNDPRGGREQIEPWCEETTARYLEPRALGAALWESGYPISDTYEAIPSHFHNPDGYSP